MKYDCIEYGGRIFRTGNLRPVWKATKVAIFPKQSLDLTAIRGLIDDPQRVRSRNQFPAEWIYNQGSIGSCNGCAAAKALERARVKAGMSRIVLSGEYLYSRINQSRDVGSMLDDGMKWITENGVAPWKPQHAEKYRERDFSAEDVRDSQRYRGIECYGVNSEVELATGLALGFVGVVAVHATNSFMKLNRDGVVNRSTGPGNHAVLVDDLRIRDGIEFDMANSWGVEYGEDGRGWITWDDHLSGPNRHHFFYLIRATSADSTDEMPELNDHRK